MKFSDFYGYEQIRSNKQSSEGIDLPQINLDILRTSQNNKKINTDICGKKSTNGQNSILAAIFSSANLCQYLQMVAELVFTGPELSKARPKLGYPGQAGP